MITNIIKKIYNFVIMKINFYHTSGTRYKIGDIIGGPGHKVFMHTDVVPHWTIQSIVKLGYTSYKELEKTEKAKNDIFSKKWDEWVASGQIGEAPEYTTRYELINKKFVNTIVYQVRPVKKPVYLPSNREYVVENGFVEIVKIIGNASGILKNNERILGKKYILRSMAIK